MGWVKENLSVGDYIDYNVRGLIITKEKDDKLEYAIKMISRVNVFLFTVSFELKKVF